MVKSTWERIKLPLLIFFMMMATDSALVTTNNNRMFARVAWIMMLVCVFFFAIKVERYKKNALCFLFLFSASLLFTMFFSRGEGIINYIQRIILVWLAFYIADKFEYSVFMDAFVRMIRFICVISLIGVVFYKFICDMTFIPEFYSGEYGYRCLLFTNVPYHSTRNFGPLWEPGAFQIYVNLALLYEVRNNPKIRIGNIVLFALTVVSTRSTSGIIVVVLIVGYYLFIKKTKEVVANRKYTKILVFVFGIIAFFIILQSGVFINQIFGKIEAFIENSDKINSANVSAYVRFKGIAANISLFFEKPLFGWGINELGNEFMTRYGFTSNTCTILAVASTYGIIPFLLYNSLWVRAIFKAPKKREGIILGLVMLVFLATENLLVSFLFWTIMIYESNILGRKYCDLKEIDGVKNELF